MALGDGWSRAAGLACLAWLAASSAHAQCAGAAGDLAFQGEPAPPCYQSDAPFLPTRIGFEGLVGYTDRDLALGHATLGIAGRLEVELTPLLGIALAGGYQAVGDEDRDDDGDGVDDIDTPTHHALFVTLGPTLSVYTEPNRREGFRLGVAGGYLGVLSSGAGSGPFLEVSLERQAGALFVPSGRIPKHGLGHNFTLGLRAQFGLADASDYRALLVTLGYALELFAPLDPTPPGRRRRPPIEYSFGGEAFMTFAAGGPTIAGGGGALSFGLPWGKLFVFELRGDARHLAQGEPDTNAPRDPLTVFSVLGAVRIPRWFPVFFEAGGGYSAALNTTSERVPDGPILELAAGTQFPNILGCGIGITFALRNRVVFREGAREVQISAALGLRHDNLIRANVCHP